MSAKGHKRTFASQQTMSALPPKADIGRRVLDVWLRVRNRNWMKFQWWLTGMRVTGFR